MTTEIRVYDDELRIYVASLSDYNDGKLHGVWIDATLDPDEIWDAINQMLKDSPFAKDPWAIKHGLKAEEWSIHDYEGFEGINLGESTPIERVSTIAQNIEKYGKPFVVAFQDGQFEDPDDYNPDNLAGIYDDEADYGYQYFESIYGMSKLEALGHIDYAVDWHQYGVGLLSDVSYAEDADRRIYVYHS